MLTAAEVLARARSQVGRPIAYRLGAGGMKPGAQNPESRGGLDCSGFYAWCIGLSRKTDHPWYVNQNGGWLETTAITRDASLPYGFHEIAHTALPGMAIVWGDHGGRQGHIGIVSEVHEGLPVHVIHCSKGNHNATGSAVQETPATIFFRNDAIIARCALVDYGDGAA